MPFGKHRGKEIADLPSDYLGWLAARHDLRDPLLTAVHLEMEARAYASQPATRGAAKPCPAPEAADAIVSTGLRALAKRVHPDVAGGSTVEMQELNLAAEWLRALVRESAGVSS